MTGLRRLLKSEHVKLYIEHNIFFALLLVGGWMFLDYIGFFWL